MAQLLEGGDCADVKEKKDSQLSKEFSSRSYGIKGNGKREPFDRDKISKSIRIATRKRPIDSETIEKFISKIVRNLEGLGESEIPTPTIGKFIMEGLSSLDKVAYVRFASVYKNFKEAKDFEEFVGNIDETKS